MTTAEVLRELEPLGKESYRKVLLNHGAAEPCFGVKIEELKALQKRIRKDHQLALELYDTGIYDAQYLAGMIADDAQMTRADLQRWAERASPPLAGSAVPWVAAGSADGWELAIRWIESDQELVAVAGWGTLSSLVSIKADADLDLHAVKALLQRVEQTIHTAPNAVRYQMNGFVIAVGSYVQPLTSFAVEVGERIGQVTVDMGKTACKVPFAPDYIRKTQARGAVGRKRKSARC